MQDALERFVRNHAGDDPRAAFDVAVDFLTSATFLVVALVVIPLVVAAGLAAIYLAASLFNHLEARYFRKPGAIVLGRRYGSFKDWLLHRPVTLRLEDALSGVELCGPPRQGKTELLKGWGYQYLRAGVTVFVLELSGDLGPQLAAYARAMGKPVYLFDADRMDEDGNGESMKWSPLSGDPVKVPEQATTTFTTLSNTREEFFTKFNTVFLRHVVRAVRAHAERNHIVPTLYDCKRFLLEVGFRAQVLDLRRVDSAGGSRLVVGAENMDGESRSWFENRFLAWTPREFQFAEGLYLMFDDLLALPVVRQILTPGEDEEYIDLGRALATRGALIVFRLPQASLGEAVARTLATWVLQLLDQETRDRGEHLNPVITLLDELHRTLDQNNPKVTEAFTSWTADVPKHRVGAVECYQSRFMLPPDLRDTLSATARQKVFLGGSAPADAQEAEAVMGYEDQQIKSRTRAEGGVHLPGARGRAATVSEREDHLPRVRAEEIRETGRGHALVRLSVRGKLGRHMLLKTYRAPEVEDVRREFAGAAGPQEPDDSGDGRAHDWGRANRPGAAG